MADILLDAHGDWDPASLPAYTIVPKGSTLKFFTENMRLFGDSSMRRAKMLTSSANQTIESQMQVQNYTVSPAEGSEVFVVPEGMTRMVPSGKMLLCTSDKCAQNGWHSPADCQGLFADGAYENSTIYFAACRHIKLTRNSNIADIAEINTQQKLVGSEEGKPPPDVLNQIYGSDYDNMLRAAYGDPAEFRQLDDEGRQIYKDFIVKDFGEDEAPALIYRMDNFYS